MFDKSELLLLRDCLIDKNNSLSEWCRISKAEIKKVLEKVEKEIVKAEVKDEPVIVNGRGGLPT